MEQRRLRLGDILDDYCPRERRVTNHVVVAMVEEDVKHTRCSTCQSDHEYKQARVPVVRRKKEAGVLAGDGPPDAPRPRRPEAAGSDAVGNDAAGSDGVGNEEDLDVDGQTEDHEDPIEVSLLEESAAPAAIDEPEPQPPSERVREDDGPVHRRLIRATLPRPEGQVPERKEPEFTVRQQGGGGGGGGREVDGNRPQHRRNRRPHRGGGDRPGDVRFGGSPGGNDVRGGGADGNRAGRVPGPPGAARGGRPPGDSRPNDGRQSDGRPGEGRFRRRRGR